ncbi:protein of unknown function (plasmid) [Paraburkholderia dioscoreae]|uniref:Uncharacterized protein n=1 Tax=Paraburkholderia dioscoreae TaxID=2604047 RepID=A0A5Q4ZR47_9BURK|nr:hypothetical protein [Paraburkholderia dioscoreae]VVD31220.1 protein of unknown function [Paraburkholderia dioscoreae]
MESLLGLPWNRRSACCGISVRFGVEYALTAQPLPMDERLGVEQRLRELDRLGEDLHEVDKALAQASIGDERLRRLLTITGVNATVAIGLLSAIGVVER